MPKRSHQMPLRTCVVCGRKTSKSELIRIVATSEGGVTIDPTGRIPGRGAYICREGNCTEQGLKRARIENTLRMRLKDEGWAEFASAVNHKSQIMNTI